MTSPQDQSFAEAVIRLKLSDEESVAQCMKTVVDGEAPSLRDAMLRRGLITPHDADAVLRQTNRAQEQNIGPIGPVSPIGPEPPDPDRPPLIPGYEILEKLGEGGMGTVWKAHQTSLNRLVAIKVLPPALSVHRNLIERFRREALATARLTHPNIVAAIDVGVVQRPGEPDLHYFVMEYVEGESVEDLISRSGALAPERAVEIVEAVAGALEYAWSNAGIVHRDVKPANILVTRTGTVKVTDLGLARSAWESARLTTAGLAIGTPHYASPEQVQGLDEVDARSDIYSLGATLFHMITGRTPFTGESAAAVMAKHVNEDPPFATDVNAAAPPALAAVAARMMQRKPSDRYQTYAELAADLERFRHGDRPLAYSRLLDASEYGSIALSSRPPEVFTPHPALPRRPKVARPHHLLHATGALLFLGALAYLVWFLVDKGTPRPYSNSLDLWFEVSGPDAVVGANGAFPVELGPGSRVRCHVKPAKIGYLTLVLVSNEGPGCALRLRLLAPETGQSAYVRAGASTALPDVGAAYPLPSGASTVSFIALVTGSPPDPVRVRAELQRLTGELAQSEPGGLPALPRGRTLWYGADGWTAPGLDPAARGAVGALNTVCAELRKSFRANPPVLRGVAAPCAAGN